MKEFKTESKKILNMMINSIYTHKEIFLRELISNASDALDKLKYEALTKNLQDVDSSKLEIVIRKNKEERTLTIQDNGIGMTKDELENNLGIIAKSGSLDFKTKVEKKDDVDIIGQFGVGFYSAFMVAKKVEVKSKAYGSDEAFMWSSEGEDGYDITQCNKDTVGTEITLYLKDNTDDESYDEYLEDYEITDIVKKYSDYIRFPIKLETTKIDDKDSKISKDVVETINTMIPLWKKNKNEITDEEYNKFYCSMFYEVSPLKVINTKVEGNVSYNAILFIPQKAQYDYYTKNFEKGLKLYSNGVLIMDKCKELLPDCFSFVKGIVDCDLSLNISRETIQSNRQLKLIANNIENKIKTELENMLKDERDKYEDFFKEFGLQLKYGIYADWGMKKDELKDLLLYKSVKNNKYITLKEYINELGPDQKQIYYSNGKSVESVKALPQSEEILSKGYDILVFSDDIDEFTAKVIHSYNEKEFCSIKDAKLDEDKINDEDKELVTYLEDCLKEKVSKVKFTSRLKSHSICLSSQNEISIEMEKLLNNQLNENKVKAEKVLEISNTSKIYDKIKNLFATDKTQLNTLMPILYAQAEIIEGIIPENAISISDKICDLLAK